MASESSLNSRTGNLANFLYNDVRILCMVMADNDSIEYRTQYINDTWVKRCNKVIYIGAENSELWSFQIKLELKVFFVF